MAKRGKKSGSKDFQHSPFKSLKGVAVAEDKAPAEKRPAAVPPAAPVEEDETAVFDREMSLLGVSPQQRDDDQRKVEPPAEEPETCPQLHELTDDELFMASLGQMDNVFRDEIPEAAAASAPPRRMRQLRQGKLTPEAKLDLHGLNRQEAREKVRFFLEDAVFHGLKTVLVITGRGKGSSDGPVLRTFMEGYLSKEAKAWVVEWDRAPARYGGDGALVVFLKGRRKS